ncbi:hypothetical protein H4R34_001033 [Dimargaris verticillata]|uniref:Large ribosomal subunit protein bL21m n=1 Tax=Dimargaris verticillata TaxID=2761393 RepID=A0A9W8B667_9FUNG|nr:hypothetical protein H4R34_001033 [Dimargaris verticillata]
MRLLSRPTATRWHTCVKRPSAALPPRVVVNGARAFCTTLAPSTTSTTTAKASPVPTSNNPVARPHSDETKALVHRLRNQAKYYATVKVRGKCYTVTEGDLIVTDRMVDLSLGDVLNLDAVVELGSKDYTIVGKPLVSTDYFTIKAVVTEHPVSSTVVTTKFKKRKDYHKTIEYQPRYTLLRIAKLDVNKLA